MGKFPIYHAAMKSPPDPEPTALSPEHQIEAHARAAAARLMLPIARLFVAHGLKFGQAENLLKAAFVDAGREALLRAGSAVNVSRVSLSTGVHRKDAGRLLAQASSAPQGAEDAGTSRSVASAIYTRWTTHPEYRGRQAPFTLPVRDDDGGPSFERLAREVSTDAHPRSALEELRRLGLAELSPDGDRVSLVPGGFVPLLARSALLGLLADNAGAHLDTAVANVLGTGPRRLEQSVFESGLSATAAEAVDARARELWSGVMDALVPLIESLAEPDGQTHDAESPRFRVRVGMYSYTQPEEEE